MIAHNGELFQYRSTENIYKNSQIWQQIENYKMES